MGLFEKETKEEDGDKKALPKEMSNKFVFNGNKKINELSFKEGEECPANLLEHSKKHGLVKEV